MNEEKMRESLIEELGLSDLSKEKQDELIDKMTEALLKRVFLETMEKMDEKSKEDYGKMINVKSSPEKVEGFLKEKIPNYEEMVMRIVEEFKKEMKETI